jgi:hypothetical protein
MPELYREFRHLFRHQRGRRVPALLVN